jgi:hypothetical protein
MVIINSGSYVVFFFNKDLSLGLNDKISHISHCGPQTVTYKKKDHTLWLMTCPVPMHHFTVPHIYIYIYVHIHIYVYIYTYSIYIYIYINIIL